MASEAVCPQSLPVRGGKGDDAGVGREWRGLDRARRAERGTARRRDPAILLVALHRHRGLVFPSGILADAVRARRAPVRVAAVARDFAAAGIPRLLAPALMARDASLAAGVARLFARPL